MAIYFVKPYSDYYEVLREYINEISDDFNNYTSEVEHVYNEISNLKKYVFDNSRLKGKGISYYKDVVIDTLFNKSKDFSINVDAINKRFFKLLDDLYRYLDKLRFDDIELEKLKNKVNELNSLIEKQDLTLSKMEKYSADYLSINMEYANEEKKKNEYLLDKEEVNSSIKNSEEAIKELINNIDDKVKELNDLSNLLNGDDKTE